MDSAERLLKLLGLLQGRVDWTAEQLGARLGVTTRTVRRDVARLRVLGYPVEALAGPGGGYRLGAGGKLPPLLLDDEEAVAVALGLRMSAGTAIGGLEDASLSALSKLEQVLPPRLRRRLTDISTTTTSTIGLSSALADQTALATSAATIRARERMRFEYVDSERRRTERHVEPLRLVHTGRRWYLVAFDLDRDDWRTFRLDRISGQPKSTGFAASRRDAPDPVELLQRGIAIEVWKLRARVILDTPADQARAFIAPNVGSVEPRDESTSVLEIGADEPGWLARFLLNLPFAFEVESPEELRLELGRIGSSLVSAYGAGPTRSHDAAGGEDQYS